VVLETPLAATVQKVLGMRSSCILASLICVFYGHVGPLRTERLDLAVVVLSLLLFERSCPNLMCYLPLLGIELEE
jgi:hypothetical protein